MIATACGGLSALTLAGDPEVRDTRVPVLDSVVAGVKMAETRADLRKAFGISTRRHRTYAAPSKGMLESVLPPFFMKSADYWKQRA